MNGRRFFFYGTLIDPSIRRAVLRRSVSRSHLRRAVLPGFRRVFRCGATYPVLIGDLDGAVEGILASGLSPSDVARLIAYEGADYRLVEQIVIAAGGQKLRAWVFVPQTEEVASAVPWRYQEWRRRFGARFLQRLGDRRAAETAAPLGFAANRAARG
jgi:hypothetical protein